MKPVKTSQALRNQIYNLVRPLTAGFFQDTDWSNVQAIWEALRGAGVEVTILRADYRDLSSKTWQFQLEAFGKTLQGQLVACFCGTVEQPTSRYDICFIV